MFHVARAPVKDFFVQRFFALHRCAADGFVAAIFVVLFQSDLSEVGGSLIVLILRPSFEGMVVAFVAVESGGQPEMGGVFHDLVRCTEDLIIAGGRVVLVGAGCR